MTFVLIKLFFVIDLKCFTLMKETVESKTWPILIVRMGHVWRVFNSDYGTELINCDNTSSPAVPHFCIGLICVLSAISFQLMKPQPSGFEARFPFQIVRIVSPLRRGMQFTTPVRRVELYPGFNGAYQRLPAPWTLSPISLTWAKDWGFPYGSWLDQ